jgi:hypothetical protein
LFYFCRPGKEGRNIFAVILGSGEAPLLNRQQTQRVTRCARAHAAYIKTRNALDDSDDDDGPQNEDAWLFEDLKVLASLYSKLRDRGQLISLIFEVRRMFGRQESCFGWC